MSEPKLISPLLDNFAIGGAISSHHGVSCYPAMENNFDDKYIVKIVSVPASSTQLDALLLTGAYSSLDAALEYFKETAEEVIQEVAILEKLSRLEGFLPYRANQLEQKEDGTGYDVYLLSPYRRTLSRQFAREPLTYLNAVNLGIDLCSALSACRRSGYLYVDLKPNNIFVTPDKGYYIGDLGFIRLSSLQYASLPEKYRSEYTAPEVEDAFAALNATMDTYALGLILYQVYNNGVLPQAVNGESVAAPENADYEMAEIILKAIAPDPAQRWQEPSEMGQALVSYMQRNGANDTPIVPPAPVVSQSVSDDTVSEEAKATEDAEALLSNAGENDAEVITVTGAVSDLEAAAEDEVETIAQEMEEAAPQEEEEEEEEKVPTVAELLDLPELDVDGPEEDDTVSYSEITIDTSDILAQADELVSHPVPEPVVAPEPIEVPMPEPIVLEEEHAEDECDPSLDDTEAQEDSDPPQETESEPSEVEDAAPPEDIPGRKKTNWLRTGIIAVIIAALLFGGYYFYQNYYLQTIDSIVTDGAEDRLRVQVITAAENLQLNVICADPHGNKLVKSVTGGTAEFTELLPNTTYSVSVEAEGFHKLLGQVNTTYSTPVQTNIVQFAAVTGSEDGSVILGFTVEGPDSENWSISYSSEGEQAEIAAFPGHTVALNGLTIGEEYTFTLIPESELFLAGTNEITFVPSALVYAENLRIVSCVDNTLTAAWDQPADSTVASWTVRCNGENFSESIIVTEPIAVFEGLDHAQSYTVEVIAAGMSVSQRANVQAGSVTISDAVVDDTVSGQLTLSWNASAPVPADGWIIKTFVNGVELYAPIISNENSAVISPVVPNAQYIFELSDMNETQYLGTPIAYQSGAAAVYACDYEGYEITADDITFRMCRTPDEIGWNRYDVHDYDYVDTYAAGEAASFLMHMEKEYGDSRDDIVTTYVVYNADGVPVSLNSQTAVWDDMWYRYYGELDIPEMPSTPGEYTLEVYFNGALVNTQVFTITQ